nr:uncharacterized protein LOC127296059 [Lolium perenne]
MDTLDLSSRGDGDLRSRRLRRETTATKARDNFVWQSAPQSSRGGGDLCHRAPHFGGIRGRGDEHEAGIEVEADMQEEEEEEPDMEEEEAEGDGKHGGKAEAVLQGLR